MSKKSLSYQMNQDEFLKNRNIVFIEFKHYVDNLYHFEGVRLDSTQDGDFKTNEFNGALRANSLEDAFKIYKENSK